MSASAVQQASSTFDMIDRNHDGVITRAEFNQALAMPAVTYAGTAPSVASGTMVQQAAVMQPQPVVYSAAQQPVVYEQAAAPVMFTGQPQATYVATQPAQTVYEQAAPAVTYAAAPTSQVVYEQTSPPVTYEAAPSAQVVTYGQTAPAFTYAAVPAPAVTTAAVPAPTLISYPANAASQAAAQVSYSSAAVTTTQQPMQYAGPSVQLATEHSVPAAGSVSIVAPQPYIVESNVVAGAPPSIPTYMTPMVQPQAAYYQVGGVQAVAVQPQVTYGTNAPGMQTTTFEQQIIAQPCMAMTLPQTQQTYGSEQMMTTPAGAMMEHSAAMMEQSAAIPQQTEVVAAPVMEQPAMVASKKAKKKLTSKQKEKACC